MEGIIEEKLSAYKRKYYFNKLIRNSIITLICSLVTWLLLSSVEFGFQLSTNGRTILFILLILSFLSFLVYGIIWPILNLLGLRDRLSDEKMAKEIGGFFPEIEDKLLNTIQLSKSADSALVAASIDKRIQEIRLIPFTSAIDFKVNWKYGRILLGILGVVILSSLSFPRVFMDSTERIINFRKDFDSGAPFQFSILNNELRAFRDESFELEIALLGDQVPEDGYIIMGGRRAKLTPQGAGLFSYVIANPYQNIDFRLEAAGYESEQYSLVVMHRAEVTSFEIEIVHPAHTGGKRETLKNIGNISAPEGTIAKWKVQSTNSNEGRLIFDQKDSLVLEKEENIMLARQRLVNQESYEIQVLNVFGKNKNMLEYEIELISDAYPTVQVDYYIDTVLFEYVVAAGRFDDDYGITRAEVKYGSENSSKLNIPVQKQTKGQSFYTRIDLDSVGLDVEVLELFVEVTDNDALNNFKRTRSQPFRLRLPSKDDLKQQIEEKSQRSEKNLSESIEDTKTLNEKIKEVQDRLRSKKEIDWQEERLLEEILKQRQELEKEIETLQQEFRQLNKSEEKFSSRDEDLRKKAEQIQELMDEVLDEETKKLYEELEKLLEEKAESEDIQDLLNQMAPNELDLEKELERTLELFKRLKVETKLENVAEELQELSEDQEELAQETGDTSNDLDSLSQEQEDIADRFEEIKEELNKIEELNQELKSPEPLGDLSQEEEEISDRLQQSQEELKNDNRGEGQKQQQQSGQKMKEMSEKLQQMQAGMQMEMMQENIDNLRDIVDNLVKLSFKEEELMRDFRSVKQVDPRFVELSQEQLKLKEDAKVIQDSLLALAERVAQISNFVTREVSDMNRNIDDALKQLRDRNRSKALSSQQFAMTSINNLSLLLSDVLQQMQQAMASQSGAGKGKEQKNQNGIPELKELQKQLGQQIEQLKQSGLQGRQLSEQLAKMAARQEMIRNQLREFEKQLKGQPGNEDAGESLGEILDQMEENEEDLVNKRLTNELIERQKEIETRMLEAEEALKDQDFDNKREAESPRDYEERRPDAFEEYFKEKEKEIELLKSVPLDLSPFYKKELNDYFRRISSDN